MSNNQNKDNNVQNTKKKKKEGSNKKSWIWKWFVENETGASCQVELANGQLCDKHYQTGGSTGILIEHLSSKHQITKEIIKEDYVVRNKL
jgi:hypothetical protein